LSVFGLKRGGEWRGGDKYEDVKSRRNSFYIPRKKSAIAKLTFQRKKEDWFNCR